MLFRSVAPGRLAGVDALMSGRPHQWHCVATQNTAALRWPLAHLRNWIQEGRTGAVKLFGHARNELAEDLRTSSLELASLVDQAAHRAAPISQIFEVGAPRPISGVHPPAPDTGRR